MALSTPVLSLRRLGLGSFLLGWGIGGFFDGILLHQILQWHHLLSGVAPDDTVRSLRFQVLSDGIFHVVTFLATLAGLWILWMARAALDLGGAGRRLMGFLLLGFGVWHIVDAILFHWALGLHRIRMDVMNPLLWDLAWFLPFGLGAAIWGIWLIRRPPSGASGSGRPAAYAASLAVLLGAPVSLLPPAGPLSDRTLAVFRPGMDFTAIVAAAEAAGGRPVWSDAAGGVWLIALDDGARPGGLYRHGAIMISNGPVSLGCLGWSEPPA